MLMNMGKRIFFISNILGKRIRSLLKLKKRKFAGRKIITDDEFDSFLKKRISEGIPTAVVRFGSTEMSELKYNEVYNLFHIKFHTWEVVKEQMRIYSGFFSNTDSELNKFCKMMIDLMPNIDLLGQWDLSGEEYFAKYYLSSNCLIGEMGQVTPRIRFANSGEDNSKYWTCALAGKRIVVVSPFAESIEKQYKNYRDKLYDPMLLPEFSIRTVKAVQTIAGNIDNRFESWFDALDYMLDEVFKEEFDIALIGCGAYGMPLAIETKKRGKIAVHLGGSLQLMFGIKGKRWDHFNYYNEYWISPCESERPNNFQMIENGCYW